MDDATGLRCSDSSGAKTNGCVNSAGMIYHNRLRGVKGKVDIVAQEKQINANSNIYFTIYHSENKILTTLDKTNKNTYIN